MAMISATNRQWRRLHVRIPLMVDVSLWVPLMSCAHQGVAVNRCGRHEAEMENKRYTGSPVGPYFVGLIDLEFDTSEQLFIIRKE
ncbi:hypothetical protein T01_5687 [Trichinella spiralis]|uniref:Uncharacterized protein n=1 Tax=Trichinella spiralis TaxID=6334 RepID=A0A0V1B4X3_TRISP|nr:hypothetical protein T01_5687 [Trichinella spiralis]